MSANLPTLPYPRPPAPAHALPPALPPAPVPPFPGYPASVPLPLRTSGLAVVGLACALGGLCTGALALPAVVLGHLALARIRHDPFLRGQGMARAALVMGYATLGVLALLVAVLWMSL